jgi:hypothetical protein
MTIGGINAGVHSSATAEHRPDRWNRPPAPRPNVGDPLQVRVEERLGDGRYMASLAGEWHVVQSAMELQVGTTIQTTVISVGERLELRYVAAGSKAATQTASSPTSESEPDSSPDSVLDDLSSRFAVQLSPAERLSIQSAMREVADEAGMAASGVFLKKLSLPVEQKALQALYSALQWNAASHPVLAALTSAVADGDTSELEKLLLKALQPDDADPQATEGVELKGLALPDSGNFNDSSAAGDGGSLEELARRLLNEQDDGALAYRYGTLPVIVADQLVELDLVHFRERGRPGVEKRDMQRLVMSFNTSMLGKIEVVAHAFGDHLSVAISSESAQSNEALEAHAAEVRDLVARLGWRVDAVTYQLNPDPARAARSVVDHVLNADRLDRLV